jgi:hypothetical protein
MIISIVFIGFPREQPLMKDSPAGPQPQPHSLQPFGGDLDIAGFQDGVADGIFNDGAQLVIWDRV